jgi:hypothetical protein
MKKFLQWKWLPAILFWGLFGVSLYLRERHPWVASAWYLVPLMLLLFVAGYSVVHAIRHRHETTTISYRGIPRWLEKFSLDEEGPRRSNDTKSNER